MVESRSGERVVAAAYRRIRREDGERVQRAEIRIDGLAGCLRTREALRPYVAEQMVAAHERGTPVIRPLFTGESSNK